MRISTVARTILLVCFVSGCVAPMPLQKDELDAPSFEDDAADAWSRPVDYRGVDWSARRTCRSTSSWQTASAATTPEGSLPSDISQPARPIAQLRVSGSLARRG